MKRCTKCGAGQPRRGLTESRITIEGVTVAGELPSWTCAKCGEHYFAGTTLARFQLFAAEALGRVGLSTGHVLQYMRKALGMRATDLAALLGVSAETVSRWENGKHAVDRAVMAIVASLVSSRLGHKTNTEELLKLYQNPSKPTDTIHIKMAS